MRVMPEFEGQPFNELPSWAFTHSGVYASHGPDGHFTQTRFIVNNEGRTVKEKSMAQDESTADGYYDDDMGADEELDLSFLDENNDEAEE